MIRGASRVLRLLVGLAVTLAVVAAAGIGALAWRLAQGPLAVDQLARLMEAQVNRGELPFRLAIGGASLAWEGFGAVDRPLDVRVRDLRVIDAAGETVASLPSGEVSLGLRALLLGRIEPRAIVLSGLRLAVLRAADGSLTLDVSGAEDPRGEAEGDRDDLALLASLGLAPVQAGETPRLASLRSVHVTGAAITVEDRQLGARWSVPDARLTVRRQPVEGGLAVLVTADGTAEAGAARVPASLVARLVPGGAMEGEIAIASASPSAIAAAVPALAALAMVEAPIALRVTTRRQSPAAPPSATLSATLGEGRVLLPDAAPLPVSAGRLAARYSGGTFTLDQFSLVLPGRHGPSPTVTVSGAAVPDEDGAWIAEARVRLDQVAVADLPVLWPEGVAPNERRWIVANITAGIARDLDVTLRAAIPASRDSVLPDRVAGSVRGQDLTVHYLRPMPPAEGVAASVTFESLAEITVAARGGRVGAIAVPEASVRLYDLDRSPNRADVRARIDTPVAEAMALIAHPRLDLFSRRGAPPAGLAGRAEVALAVRLPLIDALPLDALDVTVTARGAEVRVPDVVAGRPFERGRVDLRADRDGMRFSGTGQIGGLTAEVSGEMDFRAGPPTQVVERYGARLPAQEGLPALFGLDLAPYLVGPVAAEAAVELRRNGQGSATVRADLAQAMLAVPELGAEKPRGRPGRAEGRLSLAAGRLTGAEITRLDADEIGGRARFALSREGRLQRIEVPEARIGASRLAATVALPQGNRGEHALTLRAAVLDISRRPRGRAEQAQQQRDVASQGPAVMLDATIDRLIVAEGHDLRQVEARGAYAQGAILRGEVSARAGDRGSVRARIAPDGAARRSLTLTADDAGAFLNALDILTTMQGGSLTIRGVFDDGTPSRTLTGEAELTEFRLREAPAAARVLQAMTLYGVLEVARGPGVAFSRAFANFTFADGRLELRDARAISPSLGFTARGTIDRTHDRIDLEGTIVPAYVINSLLGHIPLIGRLFSPEAGGGVFAATYRVRGPLADPEASVNPLAALTPGFLRGLFGMFEGGAGTAPSPSTDAQEGQRGG